MDTIVNGPNNDYSKFKTKTIDELPIQFLNLPNSMAQDLLDNKQLTTLYDLFIAYDNNLFSDFRKPLIMQLKGEIEILRNIYLGEPLTADSILMELFTDIIGSEEKQRQLQRLGFTIREFTILQNIYQIRNLPLDISLVDLLEYSKSLQPEVQADETVLVDTINSMSKIEYHNLKFKSEFLVSYIENKEKIRLGISGTMSSPKQNMIESQQTLKTLLIRRANLDEQISKLRKQTNNSHPIERRNSK